MRKRYIQDRKTGKLILVEKNRKDLPVPAIQGDIESFVSHIDGSVIGSRRDLREHNIRHGVVSHAETQGDGVAKQQAREDFYAGRPYDTERRLDAIRFAYETQASGRSKAEIRQMAENYRRFNK